MENSNHAAWFLGPKAEHSDTWEKMLVYIFRDYVHWRRNYFPNDNFVINSRMRREHELMADKFNDELNRILASFKSQNPSYSPRYIAHMVSEQTLPSVAGYFAGMLYNPNNISGESSPVGFPLEIEVGKIVAEMLGYDPESAWTHISSGGTLANIESMWVARTVKFAPFMVREFCALEALPFMAELANGSRVDIRKVDDYTLLHIAPTEAIRMSRRLLHYMISEHGMLPDAAVALFTSFTKSSQYNIIERGIYNVMGKVGFRPLLYLSPSAHYSLKKAVDVLGYGHDSLVFVDVDANFRMNSSDLEQKLVNAPKDSYIAAVMGIAGTTEEGAVDPMHRIVDIRSMLCREYNRSFWFHIDSAWGGYIRTLFKGYNLPTFATMDEKVERCRVNINSNSSGDCIWSGDDNNYRSFLSFAESDSVTIDPHKLGYIPYPAGMVSFKDGLVTELVRQDAAYVFTKHSGVEMDYSFSVDSIGGYILEGSKPGAAAASCYLAHKTIPLDIQGHGSIIKSTLVSTQKLQRLMSEHLSKFDYYNKLMSVKHKHLDGLDSAVADGSMAAGDRLFTFRPIHRPDTNLICYILVPMVAVEGKFEVDTTLGLEQINSVNSDLYSTMAMFEDSDVKMQDFDFFVSKTHFTSSLYSYDSLEAILKPLGVNRSSYDSHGLFVLRSTVMNPFYMLAMDGGKDYLEEFIVSMHAKAVGIFRRRSF